MTDTTIILVTLLIVAVIAIVVVVREYRKKALASLAEITTRTQTLDVPLTATGVNIYTGNWKATGKNISVPQYRVDVTINWTSADGTNKTKMETLLFPNALSRVGAADLKDWVTDLLISEARERLGVE